METEDERLRSAREANRTRPRPAGTPVPDIPAEQPDRWIQTGRDDLLAGLPEAVQRNLDAFLGSDDAGRARIDVRKLIRRYPEHRDRIVAIVSLVTDLQEDLT